MDLKARFAKLKSGYDHKSANEKGNGFKLIKRIKFFFKRFFHIGTKISESTDEIDLPKPVEKRLLDTDWETNDVLVGSVRNEEQYRHCLKRKYYYVPARFMTYGVNSIHFVAMALPKSSDEPGIRYYGKVIRKSEVKRGTIPFPPGRNNADEKYYTFVVDNWTPLDHPVLPQNEPVYEPRSTNLFLLENCDRTYELFNVHCKEEYILLYKLKNLCLSGTSANRKGKEYFFKINEKYTVVMRGGSIELKDRSGNIIGGFPVIDFQNNPKHIFKEVCRISKIGNSGIRDK